MGMENGPFSFTLSVLTPSLAKSAIAMKKQSRIVDYRNQLAEKLAPATVNRDVKIIRMIFRQARLDGYLFQDPAEGVSIIKSRNGGKRPRRPLTVAEIQSILSIADPEWQSLIKFGLYTGQRLADLASLTWDQVDLQRNEIRLVTRKTGKHLLLPIAGALHSHIESLDPADRPGVPVHPRAYASRKEQGRVNTLSNDFTDLMAQVGLRPALTHQSRIKREGQGRKTRRNGYQFSFPTSQRGFTDERRRHS
jgi:integrase